MRKVCMARGHLPHGSMVGWFMPLETSLPHGFQREFSVVQARLACYIGIRVLTNLGVGEIPLKVIYCFELCRGEFSIKIFSIKLQNLKQMTSVEPVDELQEQVVRYIDERLGPSL